MTVTQQEQTQVRHCRRCRAVMREDEWDRFCDRCFLATCRRCNECGEPLTANVERSGICFRCEPDSDFWIERHMEDDHED